MKPIKRIRDTITQKEVQHLINYIQADSSLRVQRKERLILSFQLLNLLFLRVNELTQITDKQIVEVQNKLNRRPRKILGYKTPAEVFFDIITKSYIAV
jgi:hypothetical protein